jgi:HD-GYP domain-containing protein (c-di-GMP phosphodiesterase class II)
MRRFAGASTVTFPMTENKEPLLPLSGAGDLAAIDQDPHYVRSVTGVGERQEVVAQEDIYASNGMKLLAKGARIDNSKLERLTEHKLKVPLDMVLGAANTVDHHALSADAEKEIAASPLLGKVASRSGDPRGLKFSFGRLTLPKPLAFRLTVMRDDRERLYHHSLRVAIIAHYIAARLQMPQSQKESLLLAALSHDLGEMHTDPELLSDMRRLTAKERRYIHVHPITSYVVLQEMKAAPPEAMQAVLQHHERCDGSGYPYGVTGEKIGKLGCILAVAEMHEGAMQKQDVRRLDVILRFNRYRLDPEAINALRQLVQIEPGGVEGLTEADIAATEVNRLFGVFNAWPGLHETIAGNDVNAPLQFLTERMKTVQSLALQAGIDSDLIAMLDLVNEDAAVLHELQTLLDEMNRLLAEVASEVERRTLGNEACRPTAEQVIALLRPSAA